MIYHKYDCNYTFFIKKYIKYYLETYDFLSPSVICYWTNVWILDKYLYTLDKCLLYEFWTNVCYMNSVQRVFTGRVNIPLLYIGRPPCRVAWSLYKTKWTCKPDDIRYGNAIGKPNQDNDRRLSDHSMCWSTASYGHEHLDD